MNDSRETYSPFWPVAIVFLTFVFLQTVSIKTILDQRKQLKAARAELEILAPQAAKINQTVENLGHDLLSMTNKAARQIVADFKISPAEQPKTTK